LALVERVQEKGKGDDDKGIASLTAILRGQETTDRPQMACIDTIPYVLFWVVVGGMGALGSSSSSGLNLRCPGMFTG